MTTSDNDDQTAQQPQPNQQEAAEQGNPKAHGAPGRIGRYEVIDHLGSGAMADIYRARDPEIDRIVAIKVLKSSLSNEQDLDRFFREAKAAGGLTHPNIVTIHDVGRIGERPYFTMELVEGPTLEDLMRSGRQLTDRQILEISIDLAKALDYAHSNNIVHRDVKPANVLFVPGTFQPKIADFGIARFEASDSGLLTHTSTVLGTPRYMSPEQAMGQTVDHRTDLFSLGVVLFELLTGTKAFNAATTTSLLIQITQEKPRSFSDVDHSVPIGLQRIVRKLLAKQPKRRFQSGRELVTALERELAVAVEREEDAKRSRHVPLRVRWAATMGGIVSIVLAVSIITVVSVLSDLIRSQTLDSGAALANFVATEAAIPVLGEDWVRLETFVTEAARRNTFEYLAIYDHRGELRATTHPEFEINLASDTLNEGNDVGVRAREPLDDSPVIDFEADILFQNTPIGTIHLGVSTRGYLSVMRTAWWLMAVLAAVTLVSVVCMIYAFGGLLSRPLRSLGRSMIIFANGDLDHRPSSVRNDEIGELYASFHKMADTLQERFSGDEETGLLPPKVALTKGRTTVDTTIVYHPDGK